MRDIFMEWFHLATWSSNVNNVINFFSQKYLCNVYAYRCLQLQSVLERKKSFGTKKIIYAWFGLCFLYSV